MKGNKKAKLRCCSYHQTVKDKIRSLVETKKCDEILIKHCNFVLECSEKIISEHNKEIAKIEAKKAEVLKDFTEAPEKLIRLNAHLAEMVEKITGIKDAASGKKQKIKRVKSLRERLVALQEECEAEGIDVDSIINEL